MLLLLYITDLRRYCYGNVTFDPIVSLSCATACAVTLPGLQMCLSSFRGPCIARTGSLTGMRHASSQDKSAHQHSVSIECCELP